MDEAAGRRPPGWSPQRPITREIMKPIQTYRAPGIAVTFDPNVCAHSGVCIRSLPAVFDVNRPDWIQPGSGPIAEIQAVIDRCPSGALKYTLEAAATPRSEEAVAATARLSRNGPIVIQGKFDLIDEDGQAIPHSGRVSLCRCGGTQKAPLCDGTHKANGFCSRSEPVS
jgi:uncharacterized Fe-S cluster protein YjdI/CDGSH-type Zn-finger protein